MPSVEQAAVSPPGRQDRTASRNTARAMAVPVSTAIVRRADFPVHVSGLGSVQAFDKVTVRSRVDGQITKIFYKQGQLIKEGDPLVEIDKRPFQAALDQALAKKAQDEAMLKNARLDLQRYSSLSSESFASRQQLDTQKALVDQLTAQIAGDDATISNARTQLDYTTITSPLTGRVGFRLVDAGNIVHASDQNGLVTIVKLQPISVVFTAPENLLPTINQAAAAGDVPVDALSSDGQATLAQGHLAFVDNAINEASGTIGLKATFENENKALWPGLSVSTSMLVQTLKQVVVAPEDAVQHGPNGLFAYVLDGDKATVRAIKVSQSSDGQVVVTSGLSVGDRVVVAGQYRLQPGTAVEARDATAQAKAPTR